MKNVVLQKGFRKSENFFSSDEILQGYVKKYLSSVYSEVEPSLKYTGEQAATVMEELSYLADKNPPQLKKRNLLGETLDEIVFHPVYHQLTEIAVRSKMFQYKWHEVYRNRYKAYAHKIGFSIGYLYAMTELSLYCPLCMTDGAARLVDKFCTEEEKQRLLPHFGASEVSQFYTGAMFLTEKTGGSDVGANLLRASYLKDRTYLLNGEKWFCSNANAEVAFVLARTNPNIEGTKGLSLFLLLKEKADGSKNYREVVRLKDKLGVRSMASAEIIFRDTEATLVGQEYEGFKQMTEMVNLSRLYNSVAAVAAERRAMIEAWQYLHFRMLFGKNALEHSLIQEDFFVLGCEVLGDFLLTFKAIDVLDYADNQSTQLPHAKELARILIPIAKYSTAENAYQIIQKSMELMGGNGYIEDGIMPRLMRDALVLPIWEGAGNIMFLDMIRACIKSNAFQLLAEFIHQQLRNLQQPLVLQEWNQLVQYLSVALQNPNNHNLLRFYFKRLIKFLKLALCIEQTPNLPAAVVASEFFSQTHTNHPVTFSFDKLQKVIAWNF